MSQVMMLAQDYSELELQLFNAQILNVYFNLALPLIDRLIKVVAIL